MHLSALIQQIHSELESEESELRIRTPSSVVCVLHSYRVSIPFKFCVVYVIRICFVSIVCIACISRIHNFICH